jgi:hypothetical protein
LESSIRFLSDPQGGAVIRPFGSGYRLHKANLISVLFSLDLPKGQSESAGKVTNQEQEKESGRNNLSGLQRAGPGQCRGAQQPRGDVLEEGKRLHHVFSAN